MTTEAIAWGLAPTEPGRPSGVGPSGASRRSPARVFALALGVVYILAGTTGFLATGLHDFAGPLKSTLIVFAVNPLHNIIHIALGVVGVVGSRNHRLAKLTNLGLGVVLGLVTVLGFAHVLGFLGIDGLQNPDNFLHLVTAALALYFGSAGAEPRDVPAAAG